jgi:hypothetical protein
LDEKQRAEMGKFAWAHMGSSFFSNAVFFLISLTSRDYYLGYSRCGIVFVLLCALLFSSEGKYFDKQA